MLYACPGWRSTSRSAAAALPNFAILPRLTHQAASAHLPTVESRRAKATVAVEGPHNAHVAHTPAHLPMDGTSLGPARSYQAPRSDDGHNDIGEAEHEVRPPRPSCASPTASRAELSSWEWGVNSLSARAREG